MKTKYLFMSCEQNAGQNHEIRQIRAQLDMWQFKKKIWQQELRLKLYF